MVRCGKQEKENHCDKPSTENDGAKRLFTDFDHNDVTESQGQIGRALVDIGGVVTVCIA